MIKSKTNNCVIKSQHTTHSQVKEMDRVEKMDAPLSRSTSGMNANVHVRVYVCVCARVCACICRCGCMCVRVRKSVCVCATESTQGASPFLLRLGTAIYGNTCKVYAWAHV